MQPPGLWVQGDSHDTGRLPVRTFSLRYEETKVVRVTRYWQMQQVALFEQIVVTDTVKETWLDTLHQDMRGVLPLPYLRCQWCLLAKPALSGCYDFFTLHMGPLGWVVSKGKTEVRCNDFCCTDCVEARGYRVCKLCSNAYIPGPRTPKLNNRLCGRRLCYLKLHPKLQPLQRYAVELAYEEELPVPFEIAPMEGEGRPSVVKGDYLTSVPMPTRRRVHAYTASPSIGGEYITSLLPGTFFGPVEEVEYHAGYIAVRVQNYWMKVWLKQPWLTLAFPVPRETVAAWESAGWEHRWAPLSLHLPSYRHAVTHVA